MSYLGNHQLKLKGVAALQTIEELALDIEPGKHATLKVRGLADDRVATESLLENQKVQLIAGDGKGKTIFAGPVVNTTVVEDKGVFYLEVEGISATFQLDLEKKSRSFQNTNLTYKQVIEQVIQGTPHCNANYQVGQTEKIKVPIIQYLEKDWEFIKRMASHFGATVVPEVTSGQPSFWFGMPQGSNHTLEAESDYKIWKDLGRFHEKGGTSAGYQVDDFLCCQVRTWHDWEIGDRVSFLGRIWTVAAKRGRIEQGLWVYSYRLGFAPALGLKKQYNQFISGMSIQGKVLETKGERLKVHLDIDQSQDQATAFWYPYVPASGNMMYCMPQVGTRVILYFPDDDESHAQITGCVRTNGGECKEMSDPNNRYFTTEHHKQLAMLPTALALTAVGTEQQPLQIIMAEQAATGSGGITLASHKVVNLRAKGDIEFSSDRRISCEAKTGLNIANFRVNGNTATLQSSLALKYGFDIYGKNINFETSRFTSYPAFDDGFNKGKFLRNVLIGTLAVAAIAAVAFVAAPAVLGAVGLASMITAVKIGAIAGAFVAVGFKAVSDYRAGETGTWQDYVAKATCGGVSGAIGGLATGWISTILLSGGGAFLGKLTEQGISNALGGTVNNTGWDYVAEVGGGVIGGVVGKGLTDGIKYVAMRSVGELSRTGTKQFIQKTADRFGQKYASQTGMAASTGAKKWLYTFIKAAKEGNADLINNFTVEQAEKVTVAQLKGELGRSVSINQALKLVRQNPQFFKDAGFETFSNFTKITGPSSVGGVLGEESSGFIGDLLTPEKPQVTSRESVPYLVRGAKLQCNCGNQKRMINLPLCHGVYITEAPVICESDHIALKNIMEFRHCRKTDQACSPIITGKWKGAKNDVKINGVNVITTESKLLCSRGGIITVDDSGQKTD